MPIDVIQPGKPGSANPFTICIIANPAFEAPQGSGSYQTDPVLADMAAFAACARYIVNNLFGRLPNQGEVLLGDPAIAPNVRVLAFRDPTLSPIAANALIGLDPYSSLLIPDRNAISAFIASRQINADVVYAVSKAPLHTRASAFFTTDDLGRGGVAFSVDADTLTHCYYALVPGTVAIHVSAKELTAIHEFGHAISSYQNGRILDLYADSQPGINNKRGRPIPSSFSNYYGAVVASDPTRDHIGYPAGWQSYHCELSDLANPAIMDNYWKAGVPAACQHDRITRQFIIDRVVTKINRP